MDYSENEYVLVQLELRDMDLTRITQDLRRDLIRHVGVAANIPGTAERDDQRGDAVTVGQLILTFIGSGMATALVGCLRAYISREPDLSISLVRPDGSKLELSAKNIDDATTLPLAEALLAKK